MKVFTLFGAGVEKSYGLPSGNHFFFGCMFPNKKLVDALIKHFKDYKYNINEPFELRNIKIVCKRDFFRNEIAESLRRIINNEDKKKAFLQRFQNNEIVKEAIKALLTCRGRFYDQKYNDIEEFFKKEGLEFDCDDNRLKDKLFNQFEQILSREAFLEKKKTQPNVFHTIFCENLTDDILEYLTPINISYEINECFHTILSPNCQIVNRFLMQSPGTFFSLKTAGGVGFSDHC